MTKGVGASPSGRIVFSGAPVFALTLGGLTGTDDPISVPVIGRPAGT